MRAEETGWDFKKALIVLGIDAVFGILIGLVFLVLSSVLIANGELSEAFIGVFPMISVLLGTMISGFISGKTLGKGLLIGLLQSFVTALGLYMLGVAVFVRVAPQGFDVLILLGCLAGGVLGGILSAIRRNPMHTRKLRGLL
ncbi:MAG: TIGR04086 family membrane protein [Ruminococcaceae bacterium]|nr:TIGR04086 family membrane protein [Oscillospiraceae bacterium]